MIFKKGLFRLIICLGILTSCGPGKKAIRGNYQSLDTIQVNAQNNPIDLYRATATKAWEIKNTRVALAFNYAEKTANGRTWIQLHPYFYETDSLVLDAKSMRIDTVKLNSNNLTFTYKDDELHIKLGRNYKKEETIDLYIVYKAMPYADTVGGSAAITEDRGLYFINTDYKIPNKPAQVWTQGESESNSHWLPTIDKPNTRFTFQAELTVSDSFQTLSNGYLDKQVNNGNGTRTDVWIMDKPIQAYAAMFAIGKYAIVKDEWKGKEVNYYVEKEYEPYAKLMFKNTPEMMGYFSEVTGVPYPWNKYDQVVVRDYVSGAMENTTAALFGEFINGNAREIADHDQEDIVSHELFHMWFGDYVTAESWSNLTLNESFATVGEYLWRRHKYGNASADRLIYNSLQKYLDKNARESPPLVRFHYADREDMFDRISYEKGGAILNYMQGLIGDEAFSKAMQLYLEKNALHAAEATQWRIAVEEVTGMDWNWFFEQWYMKGGHPELDLKYKYDDAAQKLILSVQQKQADSSFFYKLPLKIAVIYGTEKTVVDWNITRRRQTFTYPYKNGQRPTLIPDATHWLPGIIREDKTMQHWLAQLLQSDDYTSKRMAVMAAYRKPADSASKVIIDKALNDKIASIRSYTLSAMQSISDDGLQRRWVSQVAFMAQNDVNNEARTKAYDVLGEWKYSNAKPDMLQAIWDSSYSVAGAAIKAISKIDKDTAYVLAKRMLNYVPKAELEYNIWDIISKKGDSTDLGLYEDVASYVYGSRKMSLGSSLWTYLENVSSDKVFERGLNMMLTLTNNEAIKGYRYYMGYFILQLGKDYKQKKDSPQVKLRLALVRQYAQQMIAAEKDPDNKKQYEELLKEIYG